MSKKSTHSSGGLVDKVRGELVQHQRQPLEIVQRRNNLLASDWR